MRILGSCGAAALIGAASWTATEYGLHRFLKAEFADDYLAKGPARSSAHDVEQDRVAAFANVAPALDR